MQLEYIRDDAGNITGVFIPISDWIALTNEKNMECEDGTIPGFHTSVVQERLELYLRNPDISLDFEKVWLELKNENKL